MITGNWNCRKQNCRTGGPLWDLYDFSKWLNSKVQEESNLRDWCCAVLSHSAMSDSLRPHGLWPTRLLCPWDSPGKNTEVGCHALLQGTCPTQGLNTGLLHCRQILYSLSHQGNPWILEHVTYPFSRTSFQHTNWTRVSCIAGGFFLLDELKGKPD